MNEKIKLSDGSEWAIKRSSKGNEFVLLRDTKTKDRVNSFFYKLCWVMVYLSAIWFAVQFGLALAGVN